MTTRRTPRKLRDLLLTTLPAILILIAASSFAAEKIYFYHNDALGSPVAMTDSSGNVVWQEDYKPFGDVNNPSQQQQAANSHQFIGKELDAETGLHYFGARFYDAGTGRFLSVDPIRAVSAQTGKASATLLASAQRLNAYAYSLNNPYKYVDPDGRDAVRVNYRDYPVNTGYGFNLPLGHSAVIAVNPDTGETKYYEYGRYGTDFGKARNEWVPNLVMKEGEPTEKSLKNLYKYISEHYGKNKSVDATYYKDADFQKTVDFATDRINDKDRKAYSIINNNCKTFAVDAVKAGRKEE